MSFQAYGSIYSNWKDKRINNKNNYLFYCYEECIKLNVGIKMSITHFDYDMISFPMVLFPFWETEEHKIS